MSVPARAAPFKVEPGKFEQEAWEQAGERQHTIVRATPFKVEPGTFEGAGDGEADFSFVVLLLVVF